MDGNGKPLASILHMFVEVAGCPTVCEHCWAQGVGYGMMPVNDIQWVLEEAQRFCHDAGVNFGPYPMHEVVSHPQAPDVMQLFLNHGLHDFEPLPTTGVPIAVRDDWRELITAIGALGTRHFWVAFHGLSTEHDRFVNRRGAFQETLLAVERIQTLGFRCGANAFLTKKSATQYDELAETLQGLNLSGVAWDVARYQPTARARRYEVQRPTANDLRPIAASLQHLSVNGQEQWQNVDDYTEAAWIRKALAGGWESVCQPWELAPTESLTLVCRPNLDIQTGEAGLYGPRHGNLKRDGVAATLQNALAYGPRSKADLYRLPEVPVEELIARYGDPDGQKVYLEASSLRYRWLDQATGRA